MSELVQVLCTRPNASELISGVPFTPDADGMLSAPITRAIADEFLAVPGYALVETIEPMRRGRKPATEE